MRVARALVLITAVVFPMPLMGGAVTTLSGLRQSVSGADRVKTGLHLEGTVRAIGGNDSRWLVLEDASDVVVLELPEKPPGVAAGHRLSIRSQACEVTRGPLAIELGSGPLIDVDGHHAPVTREAALHLAKGFHPIRVEWFNGYNTSELKLEFEGPGIPREEVPAERFFHRGQVDAGETDAPMLPGLNYHNYTGRGWPALPEFSKLEPVSSGVIATVGLTKRARDEETGIVFSGFFHAPEDGDYRFFLTSDDGGSLRIGRPDVECAVVEAADVPASSPGMHASRGAGAWESIEGSVVFANKRDGHLELDLTGELSSFQVIVTDGEGLRPVDYMRRAIKVRGVVTGGKVTVIDRADLEFAGEDAAAGTLTRILDVRRLSRVDAARSLYAKIRGVVTMVMRESLVIQDSSGGVFVHFPLSASARIPRAGEVWEIEGKTDPGDFSPVIMARRGTFAGTASLPAPVKPTAEQLASGSLDAEQLEIGGVVISVSRTGMVLLNGQREIEIDGHSFYPLPLADYDREGLEKLVGAVVRIRGVLAPVWNPATRRVDRGRIRLGNAVMTVDEPSPEDPFDIEPVRAAAELFLFSSHPTAFRRVKVAGIVVHARPPEYFVSDGQSAFRVMARGNSDLRPGDRVEAVGFPKLDGLAPVLMEADVKSGGHAGLPAATVVHTVRLLPSPALDSSRVSMDAVLLEDTTRKNERLLELRAGKVRFVARLAGGNGHEGRIENGSRLRVTGVFVALPGAQANAVSDPFELLLNGMEDVQILERGPWWTTGRTIALVAILSGGLLLALAWGVILRRMVRQRGRQLAIEIEERQAVERHREMEQERSRVARDLHDELGASLTEAGILSTLVKDPRVPAEKKDDYLEQLSEICRKMVTGLDEIVWAVNPRYDSVSDLAGYYSMYAQRFLGLAGIICRLEIDDEMETRPLDSHVRHGIFLAFKEALNNIVRHSGAKEVRLSIAITGNELKVSLADDGCGMAPGMLLPGSDGLAGMEKRMQTLGGFCRVKSGAGEGTFVELGLPLERSAA